MFINNAFADSDTITIQDTNNTPDTPPSADPGMGSLMIPMLLVFVVIYFFLIRPQEKRERELKKLIASAKRGEEVIINTGIYGVISRINDNEQTAMLKIADNTEIKILKTSITDIISRNKDKEVKKIEKNPKKSAEIKEKAAK